MKFLRKSLASLFTLVFINVALLGIFFFALASTYLNPNFYWTSSVKDEIYPNLVQEISKEIFEQEPELVSYFSEEKMIEMVQTVFPFALLLEIVDGLFDQFQTVPFPDEIVISNESLKHNVKTLIETDEQLSELVDPSTIDYMSNSISLPIDRLPEQAKQFLAVVLQNTVLISYLIFAVLFLLAIVIGLLVGPPLSHRLAWISWNLFLSSVPSLTLGYSLKNKISTVYPFDNVLVQSVMNPYLDVLLRTGFIFFMVGLLGFGTYLFLRLWADPKSK